MFKDQNKEGFYEGEQMPKLSKAEVLFFGLLQSGAVKVPPVKMPENIEDQCFVDMTDPEVGPVLQGDLMLLANLYEQCRRFAARHESDGAL